MTRVLSTKILKPNQKQFLLNAGFSVVEADFIRTTALPFQLHDVADNLILTSQNAVNALAEHPEVQDVRRKPVFCVGHQTADLLDEFGFTVQEIADNAKELAEVIIKNYAADTFTFFAGNIRRNELPLALMESDVELNEIEVYETEPTPQKIGKFDAVLFFSPSGVQSFLSVNTLTDEMCFCIGNTTASALEKITDSIVIANQPSVENTIIQTINYYKSS
ncbi:uroporphyrinogen-III synthase [Flavobacterium caeni]|uniref:Uroporphyrinogen-III synthase n=1 Tax=Flavobacterium caeni TaxID=490189 RepID=A0A1G5DWV6_9FLAO|nr:uroporphyrinogen-III synthase [Flavobacterium caeni]SCY18718.1 uroporphyrinogen-III synthase [Flavobacterium caeni]